MFTTDGKGFFTITGLRRTRRSLVRKKVEIELRTRFPEQEFAFLGDPFRGLPLPLLLSERDRSVHATTRLLWCWTRLNQFGVEQLRPALQAGKIVLTDGFGLDALIYATSCVDCEVENREAERLHHGLVQIRVKAQGITPPEYFIMNADPETVDAWMVEGLPDLKDVDRSVRIKFIEQQWATIVRYFQPEHGQNPPHYFKASAEVDEVAEEMVRTIANYIHGIPEREVAVRR